MPIWAPNFLKEQLSSWACSGRTRRRCRSCFSHRRGRGTSTSPPPSTSQWSPSPSPPKQGGWKEIIWVYMKDQTSRWSALMTASPASRLSIPINAYFPPSFTFTPTLKAHETVNICSQQLEKNLQVGEDPNVSHQLPHPLLRHWGWQVSHVDGSVSPAVPSTSSRNIRTANIFYRVIFFQLPPHHPLKCLTLGSSWKNHPVLT